MRSWIRGAGVVVLGMAACAGFAADEIVVRPRFEMGSPWHYTWRMEHDSRWDPQFPGGEWASMRTDFDLVLTPERPAPGGGAVVRLDGRALESVAEGPKGALGLRADPTEASLLLGTKWLPPGPKTPLAEPMSVTFGPRLDVRASQGLEAIALYFLPSVDPRLFFALMTAPDRPVTDGQSWQQQLDVPVPTLGTEPLRVTAAFHVRESTAPGGARMVVIRLAAELALRDADIRPDRGDPFHLARGTFVASGTARWDVTNGVLVAVDAQQRLVADIDHPHVTTLTHHAESSLVLQRRATGP